MHDIQGGQSRDLPLWVHGLYEQVIGHHRLGRSFITFVILSQISCGKVQKTHIFFCIILCENSPGFAAFFQITSNN